MDQRFSKVLDIERQPSSTGIEYIAIIKRASKIFKVRTRNLPRRLDQFPCPEEGWTTNRASKGLNLETESDAETHSQCQRAGEQAEAGVELVTKTAIARIHAGGEIPA